MNSRYNHKFIILCTCLLFCLNFLNLQAQRTKSLYTQNTFSYYGTHISTGYSNQLHNIEEINSFGGEALNIGVDYLLRHKRIFNFTFGFETTFQHSNHKFNNISYDATFFYNDPTHSDLPLKYHALFNNNYEQNFQWSIGIPIFIGIQSESFYCLVGSKIEYTLNGFYKTKSDLTTIAEDPEFIESLENLINHYIGPYKITSNGNIKYNFNTTASIELGIIINSLSKYHRFTNNRFNKKIYYRLGLFADYGLLNINGNKTHATMITFPGMIDLGDGNYSVNASSIDKINLNSIWSSNLATNKQVNSLIIGCKFTILFRITKLKGISPCFCR